MEENTMAMQTLVLAHAAFGNNHFFKNNYLFQHRTDPSGIHNHLDFAKRYVADCEEKHGFAEVEAVLGRSPRADGSRRICIEGAAKKNLLPNTNVGDAAAGAGSARLPRSVAHGAGIRPCERAYLSETEARNAKAVCACRKRTCFTFSRNSPVLMNWQRELIRIVRNVAQYFDPQRQTH